MDVIQQDSKGVEMFQSDDVMSVKGCPKEQKKNIIFRSLENKEKNTQQIQ